MWGGSFGGGGVETLTLRHVKKINSTSGERRGDVEKIYLTCLYTCVTLGVTNGER